jgi:ATP-dependent RNA helicase DDX55/SPB4
MATAGSWDRIEPALQQSTLDVIHDTLGFTSMTPVQAAAIPLLLTHKDVAVEVSMTPHVVCWSSLKPQQVR